jgi:L-amino acid N-acyltransferase YncA
MIIRPMSPTDLEGLEEISHSFPSFQRKALQFTGLVFVAEDEGKLVGAIKGKTITTHAGSLGGILWLMVHPDHQNLRARSITTPLMQKLLEVFEEEKTSWQMACVDLANLPSSRGVQHFGFEPAGFTWTWKTFGLAWPKVAYEFWHVVDIGQVLWLKGKAEQREHGWPQWILLFLLFTIPWWLMGGANPLTLGLASLMMIFKEVPQHFLGILGKGNRSFHCFDSALLPNLLLALCGQWFPYFGVWLPLNKDRAQKRSQLAKVQFIGLALSLALLLSLFFFGSLPFVEASRQLLLSLPLYLFAELVLPIFPFKGSIGNRLGRG